MLFNSLPFLIFFPVVTVLYFLLAHKYRWLLLLVASCFFYMFFKPEYIIILAFTIVIDYWAGILLEGEQDTVKKKRYLVMSLVANIGVLAVFKYYNFLNTNISGLALLAGYKNPMPWLKIALPIGLSFHTFQAMSYTIEVYRGKQKAERHFGIYALYVMFYPQLVAGPIERPQHILHQFYEEHKFDYAAVTSGLRLMMWGMLKKVVIADRLALVTDPVFNNSHNYTATSLAVAAVFFSFQIYCDFSGYSDIAIGSARVMGFRLMRNFDRPYSARSVSEFWGRWHISLSSWFRDYLYIPLGGNRVGVPRMYVNLLIVFLLSGLWHGASWAFVIWGGLHWLYMVAWHATKRPRAALTKVTGINENGWVTVAAQAGVTFLLVTLAWIFFRANSVQDAIYIFRRLPSMFNEMSHMFAYGGRILNLPFSSLTIRLCWGVIGLLILVQYVHNKNNLNTLLLQQPRYVRWVVYYACVFAILYLGIFDNREFIYFQF